jgi:hypothetical protein
VPEPTEQTAPAVEGAAVAPDGELLEFKSRAEIEAMQKEIQ